MLKFASRELGVSERACVALDDLRRREDSLPLRRRNMLVSGTQQERGKLGETVERYPVE